MNKKELIFSLKQKGFSKEILNVFSKIPRENFISKKLSSYAYNDIALPIENNQTISQPYTIGVMLSLLNLKQNQKVLEIGSGSGYVLALISEITKQEVYGIEKMKELAIKSKNNLKKYSKIKVYNKDGKFGLKEFAPYDRILISAAIKKISKNLINQLKENGNLVASVESGYNEQTLTLFQKEKNKLIIKKQIQDFVFVKFVGD